MRGVTILAALLAQAAGPSSPVPGTVAVLLVGDAVPPTDNQLFADAVERALLDAGFLPLPTPGQSRYVARVTVTRVVRGSAIAPVDRSGSAAQIGNWGAQVVVPFATRKTRVRRVVETDLTVQLLTRRDGRPVWRGTALTVQVDGTGADWSAALAAKLAPAMLRTFPTEMASPVSVP